MRRRVCTCGVSVIFYISAVVYVLGHRDKHAESLTLQNWKKGIAAQWPMGGGAKKLLLSFSFWFASSPSSNSNRADSSYPPCAWQEQEGEVIPLISWCGTCPQTEPLILLIDSFVVFPYSWLLVVFVRGAELIHRVMEFGLGASKYQRRVIVVTEIKTFSITVIKFFRPSQAVYVTANI